MASAGVCRSVVWLLLAVLAGVVSLWVLSTRADSYTGTPEAKRVARQMLDYYKHVRFVSGRFSGDVFYCPEFYNGYTLGHPGPRYPTCTSRATVTQVTQLSSGRQELVVGQVTAAGRPSLTFVARRSGRYVLDPNRGCWRNNQPGLDRGAPFLFERNERLTIAGRRGGYTTLIGTIPHELVETDRINTRTHELRSLHMAFISRPRDKVTLRFRTVRAGPAAPGVTPACP